MKNLKTCLESQDLPSEESGIPEPPVLEKDKKAVVMQGPLSTIMALTLMKRYSEPQSPDDNSTPAVEPVTEVAGATEDKTSSTETTHVDPDAEKTPQSLSMEMQMAYAEDMMDKVQTQTLISQAEIAEEKERYRSYFVSTTKAEFVLLE